MGDAAKQNYGHLHVTFDDGSVGWYEAGWGPMMSEIAFFVKDVVGPNGCVSIVVPQDGQTAKRKGDAVSDSADIDQHTKTNALKIHHADVDADKNFAKPDEIMGMDDEPDHQELCDREQEYFLKAIQRRSRSVRIHGRGGQQPAHRPGGRREHRKAASGATGLTARIARLGRWDGGWRPCDADRVSDHPGRRNGWTASVPRSRVATRPRPLTLFEETDCFWRDLLSFSWNIITLEGNGSRSRPCWTRGSVTVRPADWRIDGEATARRRASPKPGSPSKRRSSRGRGHMRLRDGKCWTLLTTMDELKGFEERKGVRRIPGVEHRARRDRTTWLEERNRDADRARDDAVQPYCLIIGGGQGGIALGARLRRLGVPTLMVEKNQRAGDSWRNRYRSLVLHDPVWYDHLPYLPFPGRLAGVHAEGQDGRLAGNVRPRNGTELLAVDRMPPRGL